MIETAQVQLATNNITKIGDVDPLKEIRESVGKVPTSQKTNDPESKVLVPFISPTASASSSENKPEQSRPTSPQATREREIEEKTGCTDGDTYKGQIKIHLKEEYEDNGQGNHGMSAYASPNGQGISISFGKSIKFGEKSSNGRVGLVNDSVKFPKKQ